MRKTNTLIFIGVKITFPTEPTQHFIYLFTPVLTQKEKSHSLKAEEGAMRVSLTLGKFVTLQRPGSH